MKKKHKIILLVIGIFLIISLMISLSYAYYIFGVSQTSTNVLRTDCFEITYTEDNAINLSDTISLTDEEAYELTPYHFTIKNVCNTVMEYDINIETLNASTINLNAVAVRLDNRKKKILGSIANNDSSLIVNNTISSSSKTIYNNLLKPNEEKSFNLRIWVDEDALVEQSANKTFSSKVVINTKLVPNYSEATLISGTNFYSSLYNLSGETSSITSIQRSLTSPQLSDNAVDISDSTSEKPVYAWFDDGTIYIYSEANKIYMNEDSSQMFVGLPNITQLDLSMFDSSRVKNMYRMFANYGNDLDLSDLDTSNVENMSYMFNYINTKNLDLSNFNTSKVKNMEYMFWNMYALESLNVSSFDTSNVENMSYMFQNCLSLKKLDLSNFNTSKVTNMASMFSYMYKLESLNVSSFDTSNVTNINSMFYYLESLTSLDVSNFNTSNVTSMGNMFKLMQRLTSLDISSFDTSNVDNMSGMFGIMPNLEKIYVSNLWDTSNVTSSDFMFKGDTKLVGGAGTAYDANHTDAEYARVDDSANDKPGYFTLKTT